MAATLPFPFPLAQEEIRRRRAGVLAGLLAMDEGFCALPVTGIRLRTLRAALDSYDRLFLNGFLSTALVLIFVFL